jgi:hypothetical protein
LTIADSAGERFDVSTDRYFAHGELGQRLAFRRDELLFAISDPNAERRSADVTELQAVEAALARLRDGTFGRCVDCGSSIGDLRLRAHPTSLRCLECQVERESAASVTMARR